MSASSKTAQIEESQKSNVISVPVKMGSNRMAIDIECVNGQSTSDATISCGQFIEIVLKKCNLTGSDKLHKTYAIFESVDGIERHLRSTENVISLMNSSSANVEFVVRKIRSVEKKIIEKGSTGAKCNETLAADKQRSLLKRAYKKQRATLTMSSSEPVSKKESNPTTRPKLTRPTKTVTFTEPESISHTNTCNDEQKSTETDKTCQLNYVLRKIYKQERELQKQNKKMLKVEKSIYKHVVDLEKKLAAASVIPQVSSEEPQLINSNNSGNTDNVLVESLASSKQLDNQQRHICSQHQKQLLANLNEKLSGNYGFLQFLNYKLRNKKLDEQMQNTNAIYQHVSQNRKLCRSNDEKSNTCNSRSSSSSTLESFV